MHAPTTVGEFACYEAFAAVRTLEHAGIRAEVRGSGDTYRVVVSREHAERASTLV